MTEVIFTVYTKLIV